MDTQRQVSSDFCKKQNEANGCSEQKPIHLYHAAPFLKLN